MQTVTQDDINRLQALIDKFRPELDTIQTNLKQAQDDIDALRADVLDAKALANKAQDDGQQLLRRRRTNRKFQISGYIQARYQSRRRLRPGIAGPLSRRAFRARPGSYNGNYAQGGNVDSIWSCAGHGLKFTGTL